MRGRRRGGVEAWQETGDWRRLGRVGEGSNWSRDESCRGRRIQVPVFVEMATAWIIQSSCRSNRKVLLLELGGRKVRAPISLWCTGEGTGRVGAANPPPPLHFLAGGLQATIPSVVHWIMWPRQAVVECGDRAGGGVLGRHRGAYFCGDVAVSRNGRAGVAVYRCGSSVPMW
jgi:hypothetical protein